MDDRAGVAARKVWLEGRRADLLGRLARIGAELGSHQARDWEDLATEREGDEVLERMGRDSGQEIRRIEAALARIAAGTYGTCAACGGKIDAARLDALPFAPLCRACAAQGEGP